MTIITAPSPVQRLVRNLIVFAVVGRISGLMISTGQHLDVQVSNFANRIVKLRQSKPETKRI